MKAPAPGGKEAQVAALRIKRALENEPLASRRRETKAPAPLAAQPKETNMSKKTKSKKTTYPKAKKRSVSEAAANLKKAKSAGKQRGKSANTSIARAKKADARARKPDPIDKSFVVRAGSKLEIVVGLLTRPEGCTTADVLAATGWPSVSMPQQAKAAGLTLSKEKDGKVSRYRATPIAA